MGDPDKKIDMADDILDPELEEDLAAQPRVSSELEDARAEAAELRDRLARAQAEFENAGKRMQAQHGQAVRRASERVVEGLLPALDSLERALAHAGDSDVPGEFATGVAMVRQQILDVFAREGVSAIDPVGQPFDPTVHQAVGQRADESVPDGSVLEVYQKGYVMVDPTSGDRVIRSAMVIVSTGGPTS